MQLNPVLALLNPLPHLLGMMNPQVVHDQEHLAARILDQPLQEIDEPLALDRSVMHTKPHQPLIGDGRDHRDAVPTGPVQQLRRLPARCVASNPGGVLPNRRLIGPVDRAALCLGPSNDVRVRLARPRCQRDLVLFSRPPRWSLRRHAPAHQVFTHGSDRHVEVELGTDEFLDRPPGPQRIRQPMRIGPVLNNPLPQQRFIVTAQRAVLSLHASPVERSHSLRLESLCPQLVASCPDHHGPKADANDQGDVFPRSPIQPQAMGLGLQVQRLVRNYAQ